MNTAVHPVLRLGKTQFGTRHSRMVDDRLILRPQIHLLCM